MLYERSLAGLKQKPNEKRLRPREYLMYLKVYDLRKKKWAYRQIGEFLWKDSQVDIEKKAKEYFKRGEEFVMSPPFKPTR